MDYYYNDGKQQQGPLSLEELRRRPLQPGTPVWHEGLKGWTVAIAIPELIDLFMDLSQPVTGTSIPGAPPSPAFASAPLTQERPWQPLKPGRSPEPVKPFPPKRRHALPKGSVLIIALIALGALSLIGWGIYRNMQGSVGSETTVTTTGGVDTAALAEQRRLEAERLRLKLEEERRLARLRAMRNGWSRYFKLEPNDYDVIPIVGGILPFEVTVTNNSDYRVEELTVRIAYLKSGGEVYKTETVSFGNIPAHASRTKDAPGSSRGSSVSRKIVHVRSEKLNLCYPNGSGKKGDPYYCE